MQDLISKAKAMVHFKNLTIAGGRTLSISQLNDFATVATELQAAKSLAGAPIELMEELISDLLKQ